MTMCNNKEWGPEPEKRFQKRAAELMLEIHQAIPSKHIHRSDGQQQEARGYMKVTLTA